MAEKTEQPEQSTPPEQRNNIDMDLVMFFIKIIRTIFLGLIWMLINIFLGLYLGFGVPEESTPGRMIFFYTWFTISLGAYLYLVWRMWRKKMKAP
ncbi:hypothetical protein [Chitinophaga vietnamensis]|uniref:hypothetical protein n=1 Tax=Chitinophaga vietnamensis TaxID=2593957 RepID=UPI0011776D66|nr:hypothetical protein [Chitinophaga vietnamensis]